MMYILRKESKPDWEKRFVSKEEARIELLRHICSECISGKYQIVGTDEIVEEIPPSIENIQDLLSTACGCEYSYEEEFNDELCEELWGDFINKKLKRKDG